MYGQEMAMKINCATLNKSLIEYMCTGAACPRTLTVWKLQRAAGAKGVVQPAASEAHQGDKSETTNTADGMHMGLADKPVQRQVDPLTFGLSKSRKPISVALFTATYNQAISVEVRGMKQFMQMGSEDDRVLMDPGYSAAGWVEVAQYWVDRAYTVVNLTWHNMHVLLLLVLSRPAPIMCSSGTS